MIVYITLAFSGAFLILMAYCCWEERKEQDAEKDELKDYDRDC